MSDEKAFSMLWNVCFFSKPFSSSVPPKNCSNFLFLDKVYIKNRFINEIGENTLAERNVITTKLVFEC